MATDFDSQIVEYTRDVIQFLKLEIDRCGNVFSDGAGSGGLCTATAGNGPICNYNFLRSCRDKDAYVESGQTLWFQSHRGSKLVSIDPNEPMRALIDRVSALNIKLQPEFSAVADARMDFVMMPDYGDILPLVPFHVDKLLPSGTVSHNTDTAGEFWRKLRKQNPTIRRADLTFYEGFPNATGEADLKKKFSGKVESFKFSKDGKVKLIATSNTKRLLDETIPNAISTTNVTTSEIALADTEISITNASEFKVLKKDLFYVRGNGAQQNLRFADKTLSGNESSEGDGGTGFTPGTGMTWDKERRVFRTIAPNGTPGQIDLFEIDYDIFTYVEKATITLDGRDIAEDSNNDKLYVTSGGTSLYDVDRTTGSATLIGSFGGGFVAVDGIAFDHITGTLYGLDNAGSGTLLTISLTTGSATAIGSCGIVSIESGLAHDEEEDQFYAADSANVLTINKTTGVATDTGIDLDFTSNGMAMADKGRTYVHLIHTDENNVNLEEYMDLLHVDETNDKLKVFRKGLWNRAKSAHNVTDLEVRQAAIFAERSTTKDLLVPSTGLTLIADEVHAVDAARELLMGWGKFKWTELDHAAFMDVKYQWSLRSECKRIIEKPENLKKAISSLTETMQAMIHPNDAGLITVTPLKFANEHIDTVTLLTDSDNILLNVKKPEVDTNDEAQVSTVEAFFLPIDASKNSTDPNDYSNVYVRVDTDIAGVNGFDEEFIKQFPNPWLGSESSADEMSKLVLKRNRFAPAKFKIAVDPKEINLEVGTVVKVQSAEFLAEDGTVETRWFQVTSRQDNFDHLLLDLLDLNIEETRKPAFIAHPLANDFTSATETELLHAYIGEGVDDFDGNPQRAIMSDGSEGYYLQ